MNAASNKKNPKSELTANSTLHNALNFQGGGGVKGAASALLRQAVAAYLNANNDLNYPMTSQEVIDAVNEALATCDAAAINELAGSLDTNNNLGCQRDEDDDGISDGGIPCRRL